MKEQRKDNLGRLLHDGESQRSDGRYMYQYKDPFGKRRTVYSWRLTRHDRIVPGKARDLSLREKETRIQADMLDKIIPNGGNLTVLMLVEKYVSIKSNTGVRETTKAGYRTVINLLKREQIGKIRIDKLRLSDAKAWLIKLQVKDGRGFSTIRTIRGVMRPAFQMAMDDDLIRKNPFSFELMSVVYNDSITREALSRKDERRFLDFIKEDDHFCRYYDAIWLLFNTGLRISEFVGLTKKDIDFKRMKISVDHQLQRYPRVGYQVVKPKTEAGIREIPMTQEVAMAFRRIMKKRKKPKVEPMIDGYTGFIFLDKDGNPTVANHWEKYFQHICEKYNRIYKKQMPKVTPHVARHTYCSRLAAAGINPKTLQYLMGHSDVSVSLNVYTHFQFEEIESELHRVIEQKCLQ